jgi:hypothetical protein
MPIRAQVDGVGTLEFPDGTDPAIVDATVKSALRERYATPSQRRGENQDARIAAAGGPLSNPFPQIFGNTARGGVDVLGGGAQLLARGANALGLVPESNPGGLLAGPKDVEAQNAQARTNIDNALGPQQPGIVSSAERFGSGGLLSAPFGPVKYMEAPMILGRMAGAGAAGGINAALQEVPNPQSTSDYFKKKGIGVAAGTVAGAVAQPIAEKIVGTIAAGLNSAADKGAAITRNLTGANSTDELVKLARSALSNSGIDYDSLADGAKQKLLGDVQTALQSYSGVNPGAVARQAAFRQEGFDPLRHWITRDPSEFTTVENLSHIPGVGGPLMNQKAALDQFAMNRLTGMRGPQVAPEQAGQQGVQDLKDYLQQAEGKANVLYRTFREIAPDVKGEPQRFVNDLYGNLEGQMALGSLPGGITNIVNSISKGQIPMTPSVLYQLQKMSNAAYKGADGSTQFALGHLSSAVDRELQNISSSVGGEGGNAADVLKMARGQFAQNRSAVENNPILGKVEENALAPESFGSTLMSSNLNTVRDTWAKMSPDSQAAIRSQVLDTLKNKAFSGASEAAGKSANQATFNNYISDPSTAEKLRTILGNEQFQTVKRLGLMLESAHMQPAGSAVNNSKTGGAMIGTALKLGQGMKDLNIVGGGPLYGLAQRSLAQSAQNVPAQALGRQSLVIDPAIEEILKRRAGGFASLLGGAAAPQGIAGLLGYAP